MNEWIKLIAETERCIERVKSNPMIPQELKDRKVTITPGMSTGGKIPHPPSIRIIGYNDK